MRKTEKAKKNLLLKLIDLSERNPDKSKLIPAYHRHIQKIAAEMMPVAAIDSLANQSTKGLTLEKNNTVSDTKTGVGRFCNLLIGYASDAENVVLETDFKALRTKFQKAPQDEFAAACLEVVAEVRKLPEQWADLGITEAGIAAVESKIALFTVQVPKSEAVKTEAKKAVKKRTAIFKMSTVMKEKITNLAAGFIGLDDEFYADIIEIIGPKKGAAATEIVVVFKSADTQKLLSNQNARVTGRKLTPKSNKKGEIRFKFAQGGPKTIEVPLPNGEIRTFKDVEVSKGKTVTLIVEV
jgi:hypothetical protein